MFHLILHVWYKSGVKREDYFWDHKLLDARVEKLKYSNRVERYEIEDRRRGITYGNSQKA